MRPHRIHCVSTVAQTLPLKFLHALLITSVEEGFPSDDQHDLISLRIQRILTEELLCTIPFDEQTMEHMRALVGSYLALLTENYDHRFVKTVDVMNRITMRSKCFTPEQNTI